MVSGGECNSSSSTRRGGKAAGDRAERAADSEQESFGYASSASSTAPPSPAPSPGRLASSSFETDIRPAGGGSGATASSSSAPRRLPTMAIDGSTGLSVGAGVRREIEDGCDFVALVLELDDHARTAHIVYLDDANIELDVPQDELAAHPVPFPPGLLASALSQLDKVRGRRQALSAKAAVCVDFSTGKSRGSAASAAYQDGCVVSQIAAVAPEAESLKACGAGVRGVRALRGLRSSGAADGNPGA